MVLFTMSQISVLPNGTVTLITSMSIKAPLISKGPSIMSMGLIACGSKVKQRLRSGSASAYWLDEATFEKVKAAHCKDGVWNTLELHRALGLPPNNTAEAVVVAEVTEDHEGVASEVLPAKVQMFGKDGDGGRWRETVHLKGGVVQVTPASTCLDVESGRRK